MANTMRMEYPPKLIKIPVQGGRAFMTVEVWPIGHLAQLLHRKPHTIRCWERAGIIPPPIIKTSDGIRHYTADEIKVIVTHAQNEGIKNGRSFKKTEFTKKLMAEFAIIARKYQ